MNLTQARFAADPATTLTLAPQRWRLPLAVGRIDGDKHSILLQGTADLKERTPLLVNAGQMAYARVLYGGGILDGLREHMDTLPPADQIGLLNDERALGFAGYTPADRMLALAAAIPAAANPIVWERALDLLTEIDEHYGSAPPRAALRMFSLTLLAPLAARLGLTNAPNESSNITILRSTLAEVQGRFGDAAVLARARQRVAAGDGSAAEQRTALTIVAAHADPAMFDTLLTRAQKTTDPLEKQHLFQALAGVDDPASARRMIEVTLTDQIPAGSAPLLIDILTRRHPDLVWEIVAPRLDDPQLPFEKTLRWRIASGIASRSSKTERIAELEAYESRSVPPEARKPFLGSVASIRENQHIAADVLPVLDRWIAAHEGPRAAAEHAPRRPVPDPGRHYAHARGRRAGSRQSTSERQSARDFRRWDRGVRIAGHRALPHRQIPRESSGTAGGRTRGLGPRGRSDVRTEPHAAEVPAHRGVCETRSVAARFPASGREGQRGLSMFGSHTPAMNCAAPTPMPGASSSPARR